VDFELKWLGMRIFLNRSQAVSAADVVGGVFIAQRDLQKLVRCHVLAGSGLTAEITEILFELFLAGSHLSSQEHVDLEGYVSFRDLRAALGYSAGLLSRRVAWLCQHGWAETTRAVPSIAHGLHGNCQKVRITEIGRAKVGPVWRKYDALAERLLADISPSDLAAHYRINELISDKLRAPQFLTADSDPLESGPSAARPARFSARKLHPATDDPAPARPPEPAPINYLLEPEREFLD
jgi:DNA-binding MarR family transcriptional regulator